MDRDFSPVTPAEAVGEAVVSDFYLDRFVTGLHGEREGDRVISRKRVEMTGQVPVLAC